MRAFDAGGLPYGMALDLAIARVAWVLGAMPRPPAQEFPSSEARLVKELAVCILSSQNRWETVRDVVDAMDQQGVFRVLAGAPKGVTPEECLVIIGELAGRCLTRLRFHRRTRTLLARAVAISRARYGSLLCLCSDSGLATATRRKLVDEIPGLGPKQASMFLRNAGGLYELAVLDKHVCRYLSATEALSLHTPPTTLGPYEETEQVFVAKARTMGIPLARFDAAVWLVMRNAQPAFAS